MKLTLTNHSWSQKRCGHHRRFCHSCLRSHVASRLTDNFWNIRCPHVSHEGARCPYIFLETDLKCILDRPEDTTLVSQYEKLRMADHGDHLRAVLSSHSKSDDSESKGFELWAGNACQACPRCLVVVQKETGCNHMVCRCGAEFCFKCGGPWGPPCLCTGRVQRISGASNVAADEDHHGQLALWLRVNGRI